MSDNVVTKLALRETRGTLQPYLRASRLRFFKKCPQRFCIPLENILDVNEVLKKGHVILGFTKNGRYLMSYCLQIDNDDNSPLPCYAYSLHWWEFNQQRPLVQVFTVPLFEKEEIHQDLHLMVAESQDESKFVVYGEIRSVKDDQSHQCYVTVCSVPSPRPCPDCQHTLFGRVDEKCLKHSFAVHFKYDLLPPFPIFNPSICLRMADAILFNTGDFLMALRISSFDSHSIQWTEHVNRSYLQVSQTDGLRTGLLSSEVSSNESDRTSIAFQCSRGGTCGYSNENVCANCAPFGENQTCRFAQPESDPRKSSSSADSGVATFAVSPVEKVIVESSHLERHKVVSGFVNQLNKIHGDQVDSHKVSEEECGHVSTSEEIVNKNHQDLNSDRDENQSSCLGNQPKECNEEQKSVESLNADGFSKIIEDLSLCNSIQNAESYSDTSKSHYETEKGVFRSPNHSTAAESSSGMVCNNTEHISFAAKDSSKSDLKDVDCNSNNTSNYCDCHSEKSDKVLHVHTLYGSCGCNENVLLLSNTNLTSSVVKVYAETIDESYNELSDEFDMYDGSLPITVKTCHGRTLKQIGKINKNNPTQVSNQLLRESLDNGQTLAVHQLTLDVEQCINELIQAHEGLRDSYKSLKDYDVQIVSVCPDTGVAIIMARILVYTRKRQRSASCDLPVSPRPSLQCTGFLFSWDVCGGAVRILQVFDLDSYPEQRKYAKFNMAAKETSELRAKFFIPQSISSFVQAFSNHTVFTGKSLKYLRHPFLPLVLVL